MQAWARSFYLSKAWKQARDRKRIEAHGLCEKCGNTGEIVHHKKHLTPRNINQPEVALGIDNLELLCRECHARAHGWIAPTADGLRFDEAGNLITSPPISKNEGIL